MSVKAVRRAARWIVLALLAACVSWSWVNTGIVYQLLRQDVTAEWKIEQLQIYFAGFGVFAPLVYFLFVTVEVVIAPIPGLMLYAPGGVLFGAVVGGAIALAGNIAGAGIACSITRLIGPRWLERFCSPQQLETAQVQLSSKGVWLVLLLRLNPLTSSDIVSYAAGFTRIPVWKVMLATGCGMAPLCFAQAWMAENLLVAFPQLIYPLLALCAVYVLSVALIIRRLLIKPLNPLNPPSSSVD